MSSETVKVSIEGQPEWVEAVAGRLKEVFGVTYESKTNPVSHRPGMVQCYLRLLPPLERSEPVPDRKPA